MIYDLISKLSFLILFSSLPILVILLIISEMKEIKINFEFIDRIKLVPDVETLRYIFIYAVIGGTILSILEIKILSPLINNYLNTEPVEVPEFSYFQIVGAFILIVICGPIAEEIISRLFFII